MALALLALFGIASEATAAPTARDFRQPLQGVVATHGKAGAHAHEGAVTHRSGVIRAPAPFDAVGLAGEMRLLELRVRPAGGEWTEWIEVGNGDPLVAVGGADEVQLRTRGWRPKGELHYVDVTSSAEPQAAAKRRAQEGEVPKPRFVRRSEWGADSCPPRVKPSYGVVKSVAIHHTVSTNTYSRSQAKGIVLSICQYHRNGNGWNDIGYNALVDRFGRLYEGRAGGLRKSVVGAHAAGYNSQTAGIAAIGNHSDVSIERKPRAKLARYAAWKHSINGHRSKGRTTLVSRGGDTNRYPTGTRFRAPRILGHRDLGTTACPGEKLYVDLDWIRTRAQRIQNNHE